MKNFLSICDFESEEIMHILNRADALYEHWNNHTMPQSLKKKRVALWSWGNGFRNRVAFQLGARAMGAELCHIPGDLAIHEPIEDIGFYLNNWFDLAVIRCKSHEDLVSFSIDFKGPVINARTQYNHPCEIIGDLQYIRRIRGSIDNLNVVFVGEVSNLCRSWFAAALRLPIKVCQIAPRDYLISPSQIEEWNRSALGEIAATSELEGSIGKQTDVIYTDTWPKDLEPDILEKRFLPYQIRDQHLKKMNPKGFFLPCPPVSRNKEVSRESMKSDLCKNYQAKNFLLHSQNAIMEHLIHMN